jgi:mediator of RNA polymerase II transcription subunit 13
LRLCPSVAELTCRQNDFGEIAYIVCTAANPPTHDPSAFVATPENILARLRATERQFRENSILAALDVEARQLFTFYKKVDITAPKDQKALLMKFGFVLRSNSCTIAYKTAARLPDLMKPEQARLYRLFITAIVSSVKLLPVGDTGLQPIGPNLYLVESAPPTTEYDHFAEKRTWVLYRINLQVVPNGHIVLIISKDNRLSFRPIRHCRAGAGTDAAARESDFIAIYLAPIGRIARVSRSKLSSQMKSNGDLAEERSRETPFFNARREMWRNLLPLWLKDHMNSAVDTSDVLWIEAEVPVEELGHISNGNQVDLADAEGALDDSISWRPVFWPENLCLILDDDSLAQTSIVDVDEDPMQFVRDWILGIGSAAPKIETGRHDAKEDEEDEPLFADEGTFDDPEHFQPFGPPAFPASQTIYPTPPDVGIMHPTPGLSSVDGAAMTPANPPSGSAELVQQQDEEMPDFDDVPPASGMSGYYDEDLFEEMPDDNFGPGANGDEPNWDFFDDPGVQPKQSRSASLGRKEGSTSRGDPKQERVDDGDAKTNGGQLVDALNPVENEMFAVDGLPHMTTFAQLQMPPSQTAAQDNVQSMTENKTLHSPPRPAPPLWNSEQGKNTASTAVARRRSSIYDSPKALHSIPIHDSRYDAEGDYWFNPLPTDSTMKLRPQPSSMFHRPPSSPSGSDSSMTSSSQSPKTSDPGNVAPPLFRQWTQYDPGSQDATSHQKELDKKTIQQEVQQMLGFLKPGLVEPPSAADFYLDERDGHQAPLITSQKSQHVAQVLVDQMSQTSLLAHGEYQAEMRILPDEGIEMNVDLSGINTSANPSNLFQLTNLKADHNGVRMQGRVTRIKPSQICVKRIERPLTANISILNFWDTLNLQPANGPKHVTAFCIHPRPANIRDGSLNLLQRVSDSYVTCALGTHTIGHLAGVTDDGLISWNPDGLGERNLLQSTTMVGNALAAATGISGTVVVYMVSRGESPAAYLEMCIAFYNLFESFSKARTSSLGVSDLQLQVIPQSFIANAETLVIRPQTAYLKLAVEVYNRLPPLDVAGHPSACGSAVVLPRSENTVCLQLSPTYVSPLEKNGPCLHLAYSMSLDKKWLAAVWTDELGQTALSMSYCSHVRESGRRRPRHEIFKEMWEVSQDLMSKVRGTWRLAVVRHGYYEPAEILEWHQIVDLSPAPQKQCLLFLLSIQLQPELTVLPPPAQGKGPLVGAHNQYGTPASTPQASMTSPDQVVPATPTPGGSSFVNASTPPDPGFDPNAESDLRVFDPSEESWGIILPYGANQSRSMTELSPSQITGFLLKRRGPRGEDGYNMIEISLIRSITQTTNKPNEITADELLEDVIKQYRGLVTLGASRGCVDPNRECLPWHIATAIRSARILEQAM